MDEISLKAPAKINLFLRITGKRPDGYHQIESLMQAVDLYDEITLRPWDTVEFSCDDPGLPASENNIAYRAAMALQERHYFPGVKITLKKRIPYGTGLGGGSADAAFVLRGLCRLFDISAGPGEISRIAAGLGSDVPFFLGRGQALVTGRGEIVEELEMPTNYSVILLVPPVSISTGDVYQRVRIDLTNSGGRFLLKKRITISRFKNLLKRFSNDMEEVVFGLFPEVAGLKGILFDAGAELYAMSGSGSSVFGLFLRREVDVAAIENRLAPGVKLIECKPIVLPPFDMA